MQPCAIIPITSQVIGTLSVGCPRYNKRHKIEVWSDHKRPRAQWSSRTAWPVNNCFWRCASIGTIGRSQDTTKRPRCSRLRCPASIPSCRPKSQEENSYIPQHHRLKLALFRTDCIKTILTLSEAISFSYGFKERKREF